MSTQLNGVSYPIPWKLKWLKLIGCLFTAHLKAIVYNVTIIKFVCNENRCNFIFIS